MPNINQPSKLIRTPFDELSYEIIGCAIASHNKLGPGLREDSYQRDLESRLAEKKIPFEAQRLYEVFGTSSQDALIGYYVPDFVVDGQIIVELKALPGVGKEHIAQVIGYLAVSHCPLGLLLNFGERRLRFQRVLPPKNIQDHLVNHQWLFTPDWLKTASEDNQSS
jgi:GxxExxY protein